MNVEKLPCHFQRPNDDHILHRQKQCCWHFFELQSVATTLQQPLSLQHKHLSDAGFALLAQFDLVGMSEGKVRGGGGEELAIVGYDQSSSGSNSVSANHKYSHHPFGVNEFG